LKNSNCDGLVLDEDRFLDSPLWSGDEVEIDGRKALIVAPQLECGYATPVPWKGDWQEGG
jgi:hypothetical protein